MIKFFRLLRKKLIQEGNLKKYFFYAIGEILLVVIGILIAIQINKLYQKSLDKKAEGAVLLRMINDIDADFKRLSFIDSSYAENLNDILNIYRILAKDKITDPDTLKKAAWFNGADIKDVNCVRVTFDEIVNTGNIYKLQNDSLIHYMVEYYRLVDENTFQSREDRREFRRFLYSPEMLDYFYIRSASSNELGLAKEFLSDRNSKNYKRLVQAVNWSSGLISRGRKRNTQLIDKNRALKEALLTEIKH